MRGTQSQTRPRCNGDAVVAIVVHQNLCHATALARSFHDMDMVDAFVIPQGASHSGEIIVSEEDDADVRRLTITNTGPSPREIEATSYCELVLAPAAADLAHPAFSKLFVEIEHLSRTYQHYRLIVNETQPVSPLALQVVQKQVKQEALQ